MKQWIPPEVIEAARPEVRRTVAAVAAGGLRAGLRALLTPKAPQESETRPEGPKETERC